MGGAPWPECVFQGIAVRSSPRRALWPAPFAPQMHAQLHSLLILPLASGLPSALIRQRVSLAQDTEVSVAVRNNVRVRGAGARTMVFAHGFGCDQNMWRFVEPAFAGDFKTVLFDHVGAGGSDLKAYDKSKYSTLAGYADDVVAVGLELA